MDPLMTTVYSGVNAGFVVVVADDPGMHSSQNEQDTRRVAPYAKMPLLEPSSPSQAYYFIKEAFEISERFDIPVLLRLTMRVSHTKESFETGEARSFDRKPWIGTRKNMS
jgi:indolepyruvate ferredoxin oxidoreductase alpha subunit